MSLKWKVVALAVVPLLVAVLVIAWQLLAQASKLGEQQAGLLEVSLMEQKRAELRHAVELVEGELDALDGLSDEEARARAKTLIGAAHYGEDGYFFVYDRDGTCLVHPKLPEIVGKNLWTLRDPRGRRVIPALVESAEHGGGFQQYTWTKPSTGRPTEKLSYAAFLSRFGWLLGTGVYLDDVALATQAARREGRSGVARTMWRLAVVAMLGIALVFSGTMLLNVNEQRLADRRLRAANEALTTLRKKERARIASELHEGISQLLAAIKYRLELAEEQLSANPDEARKNLEVGLSRLRESLSDVRRVSHALRPTVIDELGWSGALARLAEDFPERTGVKLVYTDSLGSVPPEPYASELYQIVQECLMNVERWAHATEVEIAFAAGARGAIELHVVDNGCGFDAARSCAEQRPGIGLSNLRERVEDLRGTFSVASRPGRTEVFVQLYASSKEVGS